MMQHTLAMKLRNYILQRSEKVSNDWICNREKGTSVYSLNESDKKFQEIRNQNQKFILTLTDHLIGVKSYTEWIEEVGTDRARSNTPLHEVLANFKRFRVIFFKYLTQFSVDEELTINEFSSLSGDINYFFDEVVELTSLQYHKVQEEVMLAQELMLLEVSTPVIKITRDIGVLPLIGEIDSHRAIGIRERTMHQCLKSNISHLIMDLSGVPILDTMVTNEIFGIQKTLQVLGIESIITGIKPALAQTSIQLGIDFSRVQTYSTLQQALEKLLKN